jgi:hypothetical protein
MFAWGLVSEVHLHDLKVLKHTAGETPPEGDAVVATHCSMPSTGDPTLGSACNERPGLGDLGIDPLDPMEARHAHAVVAVHHKVVLAQPQ